VAVLDVVVGAVVVEVELLLPLPEVVVVDDALDPPVVSVAVAVGRP
jgi:hypothetical protein